MAFESIRKSRIVRNTASSESLLIMSIANDTALIDGTIPRIASFILSNELVEKFNFHENRVDVLIDSESNQAMFKVDNDGFKVSIPLKKDGTAKGKRGYLRFRLPKSLDALSNFSGLDITITDVSDDSITFELPKQNAVQIPLNVKINRSRNVDRPFSLGLE